MGRARPEVRQNPSHRGPGNNPAGPAPVKAPWLSGTRCRHAGSRRKKPELAGISPVATGPCDPPKHEPWVRIVFLPDSLP